MRIRQPSISPDRSAPRPAPRTHTQTHKQPLLLLAAADEVCLSDVTLSLSHKPRNARRTVQLQSICRGRNLVITQPRSVGRYTADLGSTGRPRYVSARVYSPPMSTLTTAINCSKKANLICSCLARSQSSTDAFVYKVARMCRRQQQQHVSIFAVTSVLFLDSGVHGNAVWYNSTMFTPNCTYQLSLSHHPLNHKKSLTES